MAKYSTKKIKKATHENAVNDVFQYLSVIGRTCRRANNIEEKLHGVDVKVTRERNGEKTTKTLHVLPNTEFLYENTMTMEWETQRLNRQTGVLLPVQDSLAKTLDVDFLLLYDGEADALLIIDWQAIKDNILELGTLEKQERKKGLNVTNIVIPFSALREEGVEPLLYQMRQLELKKSEWELSNYFYIP